MGYGGALTLGGARGRYCPGMTETQYADSATGPLAYVRRGPADGGGEPLLLVMGVAGHHRIWGDPFLAALADRFDVVAFDHRGIGASVRAEGAFTLTDLAADAAAVMDSVGWEDAHVVGISMGGAIAQTLVLSAPERVRSLTLGCTWPDPDDVWAPGVGKLADAAMSGDAAVAARLMFEANVSPTFATGPGRFEEFAEIAGSVKVPAPVVMMQMQAAMVHDTTARLAGVTVPTLVVHGTADDIIKVEAGQRLASAIPGARLELMEGVGHLFFWEQPERVAALVIAHALG